MHTWKVVNRITNEIIYAYTADNPVEWGGMEFSVYNHIKEEPAVSSDSGWSITVDSFFDRFKDQKIAVLSSDNPFINACITDSLSRKFIDLKGRRNELIYTLTIIQDLGYNININEILDTIPTSEELWQPYIA